MRTLLSFFPPRRLGLLLYFFLLIFFFVYFFSPQIIYSSLAESRYIRTSFPKSGNEMSSRTPRTLYVIILSERDVGKRLKLLCIEEHFAFPLIRETNESTASTEYGHYFVFVRRILKIFVCK